MKKLKIGFVVNKFPLVSETFILNQLTYLIDQGHEVLIYSLEPGNHETTHNSVKRYGLIDKTIYVPSIPKSLFGRVRTIFSTIAEDFSIRKLFDFFRCINFFKAGRPALTLFVAYHYCYFKAFKDRDIVHAHFGICGVFVAYYKLLGLLNNTQLITSFHGYDISPNKTNYFKDLYQNVMVLSKVCTVNSPYSLGLLKKIQGDLRNITILPVGLDTKKFQAPASKPKNRKISVMFCGRLIRLKGAHLVVKIAFALKSQTDSKFQFTIVGEGPEYPQLKDLIQKYGLEKTVHLVGSLTQETIIDHLASCDIFLFPGIHDPHSGRCETQGLVIQEAQAMEIPVIISDVGGIKYGMIDGITGFMVREGDVEGFCKTIKQLIVDPGLRYKMGKAGRRFVVERFDNRVLGKKLEEIYIKSLAN